jgi:hypothetical protein
VAFAQKFSSLAVSAAMRHAVARVKLAQANNILAEISKAIDRRRSHIAGKWSSPSPTAAHKLVCKYKAGLLLITLQMARFTNP